MTAPTQARRHANSRGRNSFILASSIAALFTVSPCIDTARGDLVVDSATFEENASNSYSGNTFVRSTTSTGTLDLNVPNALPSVTRSDITMDDAASKGHSVINLNGFDQVASSLSSPNSAIGKTSVINLYGNTLTIGNNSGATTTFYGSFYAGTKGSLIKDGNSVQILAGSNFFDSTSVTGGDLEIGTATTAGSLGSTDPISISNGGALTLVKLQGNLFNTAVINGSGGVGTLTVNSAVANTIDSFLSDGTVGQLALTQSGAGKTTLTNINTYTGATTVSAGELQIGTTAGASSLSGASIVSISSGGKLTLVNLENVTGNVVTDDLFTNSVTNNGAGTGTLNINSTKTITLSGSLTDGAGTLALTQNGTGTTIITGSANTYTGATAVNHGTLQIGDNTGVALLNSDVLVNAGTKFILNGAQLNGDVKLNAANVVLRNVETGFNFILGNVSGSGSLVHDGSGTTILAGVNTYTGTTTINDGTLQIGFSGISPGSSIATSGKVKVNGQGTLAIDLVDGETFPNAVSLNSTDASVNTLASGTNTLTGVISGTGALLQSGAGTAILAAKETYTGGTKVAQGILQIGAAGKPASLKNPVDVGGTLSLVNVAGNNFSNVVTNEEGGIGTLNVNSTLTITVSGAVSDSNITAGTMTLTQTGSGTAILTGNNKSYTGGTSVTAGTLQIGTSSVAGSIGTGGVSVASGSTLLLMNIAGNTLNEDVTNGVSGIGTLTVNSTKTNTLNGMLTDGAAGQLALSQIGTGTTILANPSNSYSGATKVTKGTLQIGVTGAAGSIGATSATSISNGAKMNVVNLNGSLGDVSNGVGGVGTLLFTSAATSTVTGALTDGASGTLAVTQSGTGTTILINIGNTYSGATTINKGTLRIGTTTVAGSIGATSAVSVSNGGILNVSNVNGSTFTNNVKNGVGGVGKVTVSSANTTTLSGVLSNGAAGTLALAQNGTGTTILTGLNTYTGGTTIGIGTLLANNATNSTGTGPVTINSGGTLGGSGKVSGPITLNSGGTIAPGAGSPGVAGTTLHGSSATWNGGSTLSLQISNGSIEDALALTGALTKGTGNAFTIEVTGTGVAGENYTLATFGSSTFTAADFKLELPAGYGGTLVKTATGLTLDLTTTTLPFFAKTAAVSSAELSSDTQSFDSGSGSGFTVTPAPEPGSALLLAFGGCGLLGWRRRRAKAC